MQTSRTTIAFPRGSSVVIFSVTFLAIRCIIWLWSLPKNVKDNPWFYHVHCWSLGEYHCKCIHLFQWFKCSLCLYIERKCSQMSLVVEHGSFLKFVMLESEEAMLWLSLPAARINTWTYQSICSNQQEMFICEKVLVFCIVNELYISTMCVGNTVLFHCLRWMPCTSPPGSCVGIILWSCGRQVRKKILVWHSLWTNSFPFCLYVALNL